MGKTINLHSNRRIIVCELDVDLGAAAFGKMRIMMNTGELPANDVDVIKSTMAALVNAIDTINYTHVKEITHVQVNKPVKT